MAVDIRKYDPKGRQQACENKNEESLTNLHRRR